MSPNRRERLDIYIISEAVGAGIRWTEPRDISIDEFTGIGDPRGFSSIEEHGLMGLRDDGSVKFISADEPPEKVRAMFRRGEQQR